MNNQKKIFLKNEKNIKNTTNNNDLDINNNLDLDKEKNEAKRIKYQKIDKTFLSIFCFIFVILISPGLILGCASYWCFYRIQILIIANHQKNLKSFGYHLQTAFSQIWIEIGLIILLLPWIVGAYLYFTNFKFDILWHMIVWIYLGITALIEFVWLIFCFGKNHNFIKQEFIKINSNSKENKNIEKSKKSFIYKFIMTFCSQWFCKKWINKTYIKISI